VNLRVLKSKKNFLEAQLLDTVTQSPLEQELPAHFQVYGGCKWLPINHGDQLRIKEEQVREAFHHLREQTKDTHFHEIIASPEVYGYRNKVEFSWGKYISEKEGVHDDFRFGFHAQGQFDRIIDCTYCVLADEEINSIFHAVDAFSRASGLPTYDPKRNEGFWRHLVIRKAWYTKEIMVIFSINNSFPDYTQKHEREIVAFISGLIEHFPNIVSTYLLHNSGRADIVQ